MRVDLNGKPVANLLALDGVDMYRLIDVDWTNAWSHVSNTH